LIFLVYDADFFSEAQAAFTPPPCIAPVPPPLPSFSLRAVQQHHFVHLWPSILPAKDETIFMTFEAELFDSPHTRFFPLPPFMSTGQSLSFVCPGSRSKSFTSDRGLLMTAWTPSKGSSSLSCSPFLPRRHHTRPVYRLFPALPLRKIEGLTAHCPVLFSLPPPQSALN